MDDAAELLEAAARGDADRVAALIAARPDLVGAAGDYGKTALHWAAEEDQLDVTRLLLDAGAELEATTSWGATPFEWAATMGSTRVADFLLSRGARGLSLRAAAALGKLDDVRRFVESGGSDRQSGRPAEPPSDEWPADSARMQGDAVSDALYAAARNGHGPVVEYLLTRGARVDAKGFFGATGLHWAAINGHAATVDLLIARGADVMLKDARFGATAEGWAEEGGHAAIAEALRRAR